jgi:hypothetical protein
MDVQVGREAGGRTPQRGGSTDSGPIWPEAHKARELALHGATACARPSSGAIPSSVARSSRRLVVLLVAADSCARAKRERGRKWVGFGVEELAAGSNPPRSEASRRIHTDGRDRLAALAGRRGKGRPEGTFQA